MDPGRVADERARPPTPTSRWRTDGSRSLCRSRWSCSTSKWNGTKATTVPRDSRARCASHPGRPDRDRPVLDEQPVQFPGQWQNTWTGLTYKMSQASWNPDNLGQSTIQILRDPGWLLKWIGSLLIVCGIFMLFYVKSFRRPSRSVVPPPSLRPTRKTGGGARIVST